MENNEFELQEYSNLFKAYELAENFVLKSYLHNLSEYEIVPIEQSMSNNAHLESTVRLYKLEQLTYKKDDNISLKLSAIYNSVASSEGSIVVIIDSQGITTDNIDFYIGVRNDSGRQGLTTSMDALKRSIQGNFIGSSFCEVKDKKLSKLVNSIFLESSNTVPIITSVSGAARTEINKKEIEAQGIESFIEAMRGIPYTAIFIADALSKDDIARIRNGYEDLYTSLVPLSKKQVSYNRSNSESMNVNISKSITESITTGVSYSQSNTYTTNYVKGHSKSNGKNLGLSFMISASGNKSKSESVNEGQANSDTQQKGFNEGNTKGVQKQEGHGKIEGYTEGYNLQIELNNKKAIDLLDRIDKQLCRINDKENAGIFNCCAYFISADKQDAIVAANTYKSLIIGDSIENEASVVNIWDGSTEKRNMLKSYLKKMVHPCFEVVSNEKYPIVNTNGSLINVNELAVNIGLPLVSVPGLDITEHVPFGRNTMNYDDSLSIELGTMYYMGYKDIHSKVKLNLNSLTSHTFVTGSTGSGKSNVVFNMLKELKNKKVKFLVIEPTKGEYKDVFGNLEDVYVYGTNPFETNLLLINPFSFPKGIHVLEHIERLTEIFNACWPMYAAMPAVLKESIERAYLQTGWNLNTSENKYSKYGIELFPEFKDVLREIRYVIRNSEFSDDNQGDYIGALCTRIRSLTNGIYKQIFVNSDIDESSLFDENVIIDLSRVFSSETKSLITGLIIIKLQEYRMLNEEGFNNNLKHVTVLEEAHNLLKKTSLEQSSESSNLIGKSVEMISNAIAEMRAYGEGFIIADQAPGLLDLSVIRNTNTKIILRLPEESDRKLVGRAVSLNDEQIVELAKLDTGIAAIYQNNWKSAVLCNVNYVDSGKEKFKLEANSTTYKDDLKNKILCWIFSNHENTVLKSGIEKDICMSDFGTETKICLMKLIAASRKQQKEMLLEKIICNEFLVEFQKAFEDAEVFFDDIDIWYKEIKYDLVNNNKFLMNESIINKIIVVLSKCMAENSNDKRFDDFLIQLIEYFDEKDGEFNDD